MARKVSKNLRLAAKKGKYPFLKREGLIYGLRVVNIVAAHQMPHRIEIERIHELCRLSKGEREDPRFRLLSKTQYDPTIFPALRCKFNEALGEEKATGLVYISGKVIFTGIKTIPILKDISNAFIMFLTQFERRKTFHN